MATIQDVARYANVGAATVSRVLSGNGYVKDETRQKVEAAIKALDYTPNAMARNLFFRKSGIVAVIVPEVSHPFFAEFVNSAEAALCEKGYQTMICNTYYEKNFELRYLEMLKQQRVDGIIFGGHTLDTSHFEEIFRPIVALDRDMGNHIPCVAADHIEGGRMAAEELIKAGCRNVVQFGGRYGKYKVSTPSNMRHSVFEQIMEEHGIPCYSHMMKWNSINIGSYRIAVKEALDICPDMDGAFGTDWIMMALRQALMERGRRVPEDVKLIAYDGTSAMSLVTPSITYIAQPIVELAQQAVRLVVDLIEGRSDGHENVILPVVLHRGESTKR